MFDLLEQLLSETAAQGLGYLLAVLFGIVAGLLFLQNKQIYKDLTASKDAHMADVKELAKDKEKSILEMYNAQTEAIKEATAAMQGLKSVADSTKQAVGYILNNRGNQ